MIGQISGEVKSLCKYFTESLRSEFGECGEWIKNSGCPRIRHKARNGETQDIVKNRAPRIPQITAPFILRGRHDGDGQKSENRNDQRHDIRPGRRSVEKD